MSFGVHLLRGAVAPWLGVTVVAGSAVLLLASSVFRRRAGLAVAIQQRLGFDAVAASPHSFVLYLRSFRTDSKVRDHGGGTQEDWLQYAVAPFGALVTADWPGHAAQPGAWRVVLSPDPDRWLHDVEALVTQARLVVLQVGAQTPGLAHELRSLSRQVDPEKLLLWLPMSRSLAAFDAFRAWAEPHFPRGLPSLLPSARFVQFDSAWQPTTLYAAAWEGAKHGWGGVTLSAALEPVYQRFSVTPPQRPRTVFRESLDGCMPVIVLIAVVVGVLALIVVIGWQR